MSRAAVATSLVWGALAAITIYAGVRVAQVLGTNEPPPGVAMLPGAIAYFWRCATALFGGVLMTFAALLVARQHAARVAGPLPAAIIAVTALVAAQALVAP